MSAEPNPAWRGNWTERIYQRIRGFGCETVMEYLSKFPRDPYVTVADRLGADIAAVQIEELQLNEARESEVLREAAIDSLVRALHGCLTTGWDRSRTRSTESLKAFAMWAGALKTKGGLPNDEIPLAVWHALERVNPKDGWLPLSANDDVLRQAFDSGWPSNRLK